MKRLRSYFVGFLVLLAIPSGILLLRSYDNLEEESFYFYRKTAEGLVSTLNQRLRQTLEDEERRPYTQYRYIHVADQPLPERAGLNLSPLAAYPVESAIPGILGYFQIDPDGSFHTPLLPDTVPPGGKVPDRAARLELRARLAKLLAGGTLVSQSAASVDKRGFDRETEQDSVQKSLASRADLRLENEYLKKETPRSSASKLGKDGDLSRYRQVQKSSPQQALVFENQAGPGGPGSAEERKAEGPPGAAAIAAPETASGGEPPSPSRERFTGASLEDALQERDSRQGEGRREVAAEVDPFQVRLLDNKWLIFQRKVWWGDRRYVQGFVARAEVFFDSLVGGVFEDSPLVDPSCLVLHLGELLQTIPADEGGATRPLLLLSSSLPHPLSDFTLAVTVKRLPPGPGYQVVNGAAMFLVLLVLGGSYGLYRFAAAQMELSQRKSDFVAAVSHELKTPLASIRMYGEMLVEGWVAGEEKKQVYYRHIRDESERLTRLIQNVLRLAELERNELKLSPRECEPGPFVRGVVDRLGKQIESAGFEVAIETAGTPPPIWADPDALTQILINLIDNALKFARNSDPKRIVVTVGAAGDSCSIRVRDFGPGIPKGKLNKIFERFYRIDSEATRTTRGTGIGLALVKTLSDAMGARVAVVNQKPGAEFQIHFPARSPAADPLSPPA